MATEGTEAHLRLAGRTTPEGAPDPSRPAGRRAGALDRWLVRRLLRALSDPRVAAVLWDGTEVRCAAEPPAVRVLLHDRGALLRFLINPSLAFGDGYTAGRVEVLGDLRILLEACYRANARRPRRSFRGWLRRLFSWGNPLARARDNIHHHYDIGNDFYRLWLDERLVYTCAYYADPGMSLEEAQRAKMDHVCRKLRLRPGESVVEAGCGWGALALHMARHYGVTVRAFNISHEQVAHAREQAKLQGLAGRVEFVEDDFRNLAGRYDAFVSVGMLEHVHPRNYPLLGRLIRRCLKPAGRGLIHTIGRERPDRMDPWLVRRIFPGAHIPALSEIVTALEPHGLVVLDVENLRLHYARTLEHWQERFERAAHQVEKMFDAAFVRCWRLYLVGSMMSFLAGPMQLFQIVFAPRENTDVPWTRAHLYRQDETKA